jgi:hypothetical protein
MLPVIASIGIGLAAVGLFLATLGIGSRRK